MRIWEARPKEEAYLLNPAFGCTMLCAALWSYAKATNTGAPMPLPFMFLPIVLHKPTRDSLPPNTRTSMPAWLQENAEARVLFYERLLSLKPHVREAIQFGMLFDWIVPGEGGLVETTLTDADITRMTRTLADEARDCVMRSRFLGKWFAGAGETHTVMAFWGVRP